MSRLNKQDFYYFYWLSRPINILIAFLTFTFFAYFSYLKQIDFLFDSLFWGENVLICFIMASGYWINDIFDYKIDRINKPKRTLISTFISAKKVITGYIVVSFCTTIATFLLPVTPKNSLKFIVINLSAMLSLYLYAKYLKKSAIIGNLVVSSLTALVILSAGLLQHLKTVHVWGMIFAFGITFIREITKDVEDIKGDIQFNLRTLPIEIGLRLTKKVLIVSYCIFLIFCLCPIFYYLYFEGKFKWQYLLIQFLFVFPFLLYSLILLYKAVKPSEYAIQSKLLKFSIFGGLLSMYFLTT